MTNKKIDNIETTKHDKQEKLFDYGNISDEQKLVAKEIVEIANSMGLNVLSELIKDKFKIKQYPRIDHTESLFYKKCKEIDINPALQGFNRYNGKEYPILAINQDVRALDLLVEKIKSED